MIQDQRILEEEEIVSKLALIAEFEEVAKKEETAWRQRSTAVWLKQGDRNTSFFHKTANAHRRVNTTDDFPPDYPFKPPKVCLCSTASLSRSVSVPLHSLLL
ncbi:hypothetical protein MTR67_036090 [Solanum verrucosum]|uniref:Uncharacterized protein n=1 Tax=Solanum verrucosum TaxID=315347 RepID=A0AAF0UBC7_SOLVR|nr:hypothetical protein MTR67_036090 [Solanum verrucosum]